MRYFMMNPEDQYLYACRQLRLPKSALKTWKQQMKTWEGVWKAPVDQLKDCVPQLSEDCLRLLQRRSDEFLKDSLELLKRLHCEFLSPDHLQYPQLLKQISAAPLGIFVKGNLQALAAVAPLAVVGTRQMTPYGKSVLKELIPILASSGVVIVSGLAYGVDALAHKIALEHDAQCIAVLAHGLDQVHPTQHAQLAQRLVDQGGCLVSEYPIGMEPRPQLFPARNRIISGLSRGTLVIEASQKSGSLITAKYALEQNRDVYAIPGSIFGQQQQGTNSLLSRGAQVVLSSKDLLEKLSLDAALAYAPEQRTLCFESPEEQRVYDALVEPQEMGALSEYCQIATDQLGILLSMMELKGLITSMGPGVYGRG